MSNPTMEARNRNAPVELRDDVTSSPDAPSGFILKLYQMVNGAPDEVISWTQAGDAFIIGSDLKRLESVTLPQYFRHNRFQSLVRQLNFYSFRKINRERNVWIYKHELFHRDRPEDLYLVRRRTCPGLDGRKQRFSRTSSRKTTDNSTGSEDDFSLDDPSSPIEIPNVTVKETKREVETDSEVGELKKRKRICNSEEENTAKEIEEFKKPRKLLNSEDATHIIPKKEISFDDLIKVAEEKSEVIGEALIQTSPVNERTEMAERSLVISEVAKKLDQFARKAIGTFGSKGKRQPQGVVTPPFSSALLSASSLLTYDDEYDSENKPSSSIGVVTDGDESITSGEDETNSEFPQVVLDAQNFCHALPADINLAQAISKRLIASASEDCHSKAAVVKFCVTTAPFADKNISSKIFQLIASCENLASDFQTYRAALDPFVSVDVVGRTTSYQQFSYRVAGAETTMQQAWAREASRSKAVHDFTVFAVNSIQKILGKGGTSSAVALSLAEEEKFLLERTAQAWCKNI